MDWSNERYVRLYVRETTTFRSLRWEAQALLPQLLRIVDRAGVLDIGELDPAAAMQLYLQRWPPDVISVGIADLLSRGVIEHRGGSLLWPTFLEAQEAVKSDAQRARESREKRRVAVTKRDASVTERTGASRAVTPATPSQAERSATEPSTSASPLRSEAGARLAAHARGPNGSDGERADPVKMLFDTGVSILTRAGQKETAARSLLGKLRKRHGDEETMRLLLLAGKTTAPADWLAATLREPTAAPYVPMGRK